jgi:hypothetical protein
MLRNLTVCTSGSSSKFPASTLAPTQPAPCVYATVSDLLLLLLYSLISHHFPAPLEAFHLT